MMANLPMLTLYAAYVGQQTMLEMLGGLICWLSWVGWLDLYADNACYAAWLSCMDMLA
jgi:hypothetical protein